jgi:uncharacterized protein
MTEPHQDDPRKIITSVSESVKVILETEGSGHDWQHIRRVWTNAQSIGHAENAAMTPVELAALLHDLDDWKVSGAHPGSYPDKAAAVMKERGIDVETIESVTTIIQNIDYKGSLDKDRALSLEAQVVHDADKLDAIGAVGIARCFVFNGHIGRLMFDPSVFPQDELTQAQYTDLSREKNTGINHFFDKLLRLKDRMYTTEGQRLAAKRHDFMVSYLREFFAECGCPEWVEHLDTFLSKNTA